MAIVDLLAKMRRTQTVPPPLPPELLESVVHVKVTLLGIEPAIWRSIDLAGWMTLTDLHHAIQSAFGWEDDHPNLFTVGKAEYMAPCWAPIPPRIADASTVKLAQLVHSGSHEFLYEYDFGDSWVHGCEILQTTTGHAPPSRPVCTGGDRACPPDDCGGVPGYYSLIAAFSDKRDPAYKEMKEWLGYVFKPDRFELKKANKSLSERYQYVRN